MVGQRARPLPDPDWPVTAPKGHEPLNEHSLGREPVLDDFAIARIIEKVGLPLQESVSRPAFEGQLGALGYEMMLRSFEAHPRQAQDEIRRLRKCIKSYCQLRRRLRELGLSPPDPPRAWRWAIVDWLQDQE